MYQPSAAFAELIQKDSRTFKAKLIIGQSEIETDIKSIVLRGGSNSGSSFIIGSCISQYIEVEMTKQTILIENEELEWRIGANISDTVDTFQWVFLRQINQKPMRIW